MVSSWGGYVFLINLIPMHVFVLMVSGRFSHRVYVAYSTVYVIGTILSMQISFVGFQPVQTSEHMMVSKSLLRLIQTITRHESFIFITFIQSWPYE